MRTQECREKLEWIEQNCPLDRTSITPIKKAAAFCEEHVEFSTCSTASLQPLINEKNPIIKEKAIESVKKSLESKKNASGQFTKKLTTGDVKTIINKIKTEVQPQISFEGVEAKNCMGMETYELLTSTCHKIL